MVSGSCICSGGGGGGWGGVLGGGGGEGNIKHLSKANKPSNNYQKAYRSVHDVINVDSECQVIF